MFRDENLRQVRDTWLPRHSASAGTSPASPCTDWGPVARPPGTWRCHLPRGQSRGQRSPQREQRWESGSEIFPGREAPPGSLRGTSPESLRPCPRTCGFWGNRPVMLHPCLSLELIHSFMHTCMHSSSCGSLCCAGVSAGILDAALGARAGRRAL